MPANSETSFETAFANLALASLQDRSPGLLQYLIGFQVMDSNDEKTQGIGLFGCKLGNELIYLPVFFTNGELKGSELMYLKNQDIFCPNNEAWVAYITNRKPAQFGSPSEKTRKDLVGTGIDFFPFRASPERFGKTSSISFKLGRNYQDIPVYAPNDSSRAFVTELVKQCNGAIRDGKVAEKAAQALREDRRYTRALCSELLKNAGLSAKFISLTGREKFAEILKNVKRDAQEAENGPNQKIEDASKVTILTGKDKDSWEAFNLDSEGKRKLMNGEIVIKDHRDNTSKVYPATVATQIQSPAPDSGLYSVLLEDGEMLDCWILNSPETIGYGPCCVPSYRTNKKTLSTVHIIAKGTEGVCELKGVDVFSRPLSPNPLRDNLGDLSNVSEMKEDQCYAIVNRRGGAIAPFYVVNKFKHDDGRITFRVISELDPDTRHLNNVEDHVQLIISQGEFGRIRRLGPGAIAVPEGAKIIPVSVKKDKEDEFGHKTRVHGWGAYRNWYKAKPANISNLERLLLHTGKVTPLKLYTSGTEYQVKAGECVGKLASFNETLKDLIFNHGVNGVEAERIIKAGNARYKIVYASGYPRNTKSAAALQPGPSAPTWNTPGMGTDNYLGVPVGGDMRATQPIDGMSSHLTDPAIYNPDPQLDRSVMDMINEATQTGQKEVLDTAMLGGLLKTTDSIGMVDKYISDLILGMDRVGRILFLFLRYHDKFEERYGSEDMVELEDSLRNVFKSLGDLVMFLKQKGAKKGPSESRTKVELQ